MERVKEACEGAAADEQDAVSVTAPGIAMVGRSSG